MATTVPAEQAVQSDIDLLGMHYTFRDPETVVAFVRAHPAVVTPLLDAVPVVPRYFGPGRPVVLEVERDRDVPDHTMLFALIQTDQDVDAALASLDRFGEEWWLDALPQAGAKLVFGLEYA